MNRPTIRHILYAFALIVSAPPAFARGGYGAGQHDGYSPYQDYQCPYGYSCPGNNRGYGMMGPGMMPGYHGMPRYGHGPGNSMMGPGMMGPGYGYGRQGMGPGMRGATPPQSSNP